MFIFNAEDKRKSEEIIEVTSSWIESITRLPQSRMEVKTISGQEYVFGNVSDKKFNTLVSAESVGAFFNYAIRDNPKHQI